MSRCSKVGLVMAVLFIVANVGGGVFAAAQGELLHAGMHAALVLLGGYVASRLGPMRYERRIWRSEESAAPAVPGDFTDRLTHLEQSVEAVAIEVERIGEGQRFMTRLFTEKGTPRAPREGAEQRIEMEAREAAPYVGRD